jgi:hypothetical protein
VRFSCAAAPSVVTLCHCTMCRRSVGAQSVTWATVAHAACTVEGEGLAWYRSSTHARRGFCARCGSSLFFASDHHPDELDLSVGAFDQPDRCPPTCHIHVLDKVSWVVLAPKLPCHVADSSSPRLPE